MSGELEHIRPSNPSNGWYVAARTRGICWCDANGVSHSISHVYWSPTNNVNDRKLIWQRDHAQRILVAGDKNVAIEYTPRTSNVTVNSIEIFTSQTTSSTAGRIHIYHSSGLYVGSVDGNTTDSATEKYSLTGVARSTSNMGVTLYKDETYYIVFNDGNTSLYYPAYFQNETGNYIANFIDNAQASTIHSYQNINSLKAFLPAAGGAVTEEDLQTILTLDINDLFLWNGNNLVINSQVIIHDDYLGKKLTSAISNPPITTSDSDIWNIADQQIFIRHNYGSEVVQRVWKKKQTTSYDGTFTITSRTADAACAQVLLALKKGNTSYSKILTDTPASYDVWYNYIGSNMKLTSGYKVGLTDATPLTAVPASPEDKTFYYFSSSIASSTVGFYNDCIVVYENNAWKGINPYGISEFTPYLDIITLDSVIEQISVSTLVQEDQQVSCNSSIKTSTISTDRKYYLKLNGNEV